MKIQKQKKMQDLWNLIFSVIFIGLVACAIALVYVSYGEVPSYMPFVDLAVVVLALFRLTRLFVYDAIMGFFRDIFLDVSYTRGGVIVREKFAYGARRSVSDILSCPWCFSVWASVIVLTMYIVGGQVAFFVLLFLALSGVATLVQLGANLLGWSAEHKKLETEKLR